MSEDIIKAVNSKSIIIGLLVALILGIVIGGYFTHKYYAPKLVAETALVTDLNAKYSTAIDEKEAAIVAKAVADEKANTPVIVTAKGETVTQVEYVEKASSTDSDASLTTTAAYKFEYNGTQYDVPTKTVATNNVKDGKLVLTQTTTNVMNVDDIVNRQIANTVLKSNHDIAVLKRQKKQDTVWGVIIGVGIGRVLK